MITAHKDFPYFFATLSDQAMFTPWSGKVIRQSKPRWMSLPYRFTGVGSVFAGARWSVKGLMPTIYASTDPDTLNAEIHHKGQRYGWSDEAFHSQLVVGMQWNLQAMLDLTSEATLEALKVTNEEILGCDWVTEQAEGREPLTQAIARSAFENHAEGLIVPSAQYKGGVNIVYYPSHRRDGSVVQALKEEDIPFMHGL